MSQLKLNNFILTFYKIRVNKRSAFLMLLIWLSNSIISKTVKFSESHWRLPVAVRRPKGLICDLSKANFITFRVIFCSVNLVRTVSRWLRWLILVPENHSNINHIGLAVFTLFTHSIVDWFMKCSRCIAQFETIKCTMNLLDNKSIQFSMKIYVVYISVLNFFYDHISFMSSRKKLTERITNTF